VTADTYEVFIPGSAQPVTMEVYAAYIKNRLIEDAKADIRSVDLPVVFDYTPPVKW
jgi:hypothetical protein